MSDNKIYAAITAIMGDVGAVGKNQKNQSQGFLYRGIDTVMNALQPALVKHGVFVVPEILEQTREERQTAKGTNLIYSICKIKYTFYASDGSNISAITIGEGMDSGDKATNKAMAIAFKYACFQVFCMPTEEMKDPDGESPEVLSKKEQSTVISKQQREWLFRLARAREDVCKAALGKYGYVSTKDVKGSDYESICEEITRINGEIDGDVRGQQPTKLDHL